jgi:hypothetical protein
MERLVVPFKAWHYEWLKVDHPVSEEALMQMQMQNSWTAVVDGEIVACAGTILQWAGRHTAWAYMRPETGPHMRWITRETRKVLEVVKGRIEMTVRKDFDAGHRWALLLGFSVETPVMKSYGPFGEDHTMYVRFN